jgi:hypothetical protein
MGGKWIVVLGGNDWEKRRKRKKEELTFCQGGKELWVE